MQDDIEDIVDAVAESIFGSRTWRRGVDYQRRGRVLAVELDEAAGMLRGAVQGGARRPYSVEVPLGILGCVEIDDAADVPSPDGIPFPITECTCPVGVDCKHAAALTLEALARGLIPPPATRQRPDAGRHGDEDESGAANAGPGRSASLASRPSSTPAAAPPLDPALAAWLEDLEAARSSASDDFPPNIADRLVYVLTTRERQNGSHVATIATLRTRRLKDGSLSPRAQPYSPSSVLGGGGARFLRPADRALLRRLAYVPGSGLSGHDLAGEEGAEILVGALRTGRLRFGSVEGAEIVEAPAQKAALAWRLRPDGSQSATLEVAGGPDDENGDRPGEVRVLALAPPFRLCLGGDGETASCGLLDGPVAPRLAEALLAAPPVSPASARTLGERLSQALDAPALPRPRELAPARVVARPPTPRLVLSGERLPPRYSRYGGPGMRSHAEQVGIARLSFLYDGIQVAHDERTPAATRLVDGELVRVERDTRAEQAARQRLAACELVPLSSRYDLTIPAALRSAFTTPVGAVALEDLLLLDVPALRAEGWLVDIDPSYPVEAVRLAGPVEARLEGGSGIDWFELSMGVEIDGERVDVLEPLLDVLARIPSHALEDVLSDDGDDEEEVRLRLTDRRLLVTTFGRVRPILLALARLAGRASGGRIRIGALDAGDLEESERLAGLTLRWSGADTLRSLARRLREAKSAPRPQPPACFRAQLRPYQQDGLAWLQLLREVGLGGVLADDMGLGKTVQTLAHLAIEKVQGRADRPSLIVAPTSVLTNWAAEAARFTPDLSVLYLQGPDRKARFTDIGTHDLVLSTYPLVRHDCDVLTAQAWHLLILDEAQAIKNDKAQAARMLKRFDARHRIALTGTPVENSLMDLWSLFDIVSPGLLGDRARFVREFRTPIEAHGDADAAARLSRGLRPFLLRRTKDEVVTELPPKTEIVEMVSLNDRQRATYEGIRMMMHKKVRDAIRRKGLARSRIELLEALLRLRQVCCDPRLAAGASARDAATSSAKLARLMELVPELVSEGRRILLFSQFTSMLALIADALDEAGIRHVSLTGRTRDRAAPIERFSAGEVPVFLISLKAGGSGLNLTAADTVIHYDPWWNPAVEAQATDRAHRIGQDKPVFAYKLICENTVETKIEALKGRKKALADGIYDPAGKTPFDFDEADVEFLLS